MSADVWGPDYELWTLCYDQLKLARARLESSAVYALERLREDRGATELLTLGAMLDAFDRQDAVECAEAALSTAREAWDRVYTAATGRAP